VTSSLRILTSCRKVASADVRSRVKLGPGAMSAQCPDYPGDLNRSTQHLLILLDKEVADGDVTDIVHGEAEG
jgi:hypothetical protein